VTTLLESKARPFGSKKGAALSLVVHGALIAAAVVASGSAMLPDREKLEEHSILFVNPPPPKVHTAPDPPPEPKKPPPAKAPRTAAPRAPRPVAAPPPRPSPQPVVPSVPLIAPIKVPVSIPAVDLKGPKVDVSLPASATRAADLTGRSSRTGSSDGDVESSGGSRGGLGSGASGRAYSENQVDRAVQVTRAAQPRYPDALRSVNVTGEVVASYIVDARGRVEPGSIKIISASHKLFADAVRAALLNARYRPAEVNGTPVRQLVEQPFIFKLDQ
jgi:protein TonB